MGGKSFYRNFIDSSTVYYTSSKRPFSETVNKAEVNIANYFIENFNATLLPDFQLENNPTLFLKYDIIILAYHCEYFTETMYNNLKFLVQEKNISLISLGTNQIYWKTKWNHDHSVLECRKDLTSFKNSFLDYGGMWRHHINKSEHNIIGIRYSNSGIHSYSPYQVKTSRHWIFQDTNMNDGDFFGQTGINGLGISGDETDKIVVRKHNMTLLAKGMNCIENQTVFMRPENHCDENAGADFIIIENEKNNILSTGSVESGAGLGIDSVFTKMMTNFIHRNTKKR